MIRVALTIILLSSLSLICMSVLAPPIFAQLDLPNLEEQLKLAKEKLEQVKPDYSFSNITAEQFPNRLSNFTLNQEALKEVDAIRDFILYPCNHRIGIKEDPGKLCDAFADYLVEKCKRFDNLLGFCYNGLLGEYELGRNLQISCFKNPPLYNDTLRIKSCLIVTPLNSSYTHIPPILTVGPALKSYSDIQIKLTAENPAYNPLLFKNLTYTFFKDGKKISSGCVAQPTPCRSPSSTSLQIPPSLNAEYSMEYSVDRGANQTLVNVPFVVNGTYFFQFPNSTVDGKYFSFNITKINESCTTNFLQC
jgi:hypothetical protein